jgi:hypothetical protein
MYIVDDLLDEIIRLALHAASKRNQSTAIDESKTQSWAINFALADWIASHHRQKNL